MVATTTSIIHKISIEKYNEIICNSRLTNLECAKELTKDETDTLLEFVEVKSYCDRDVITANNSEADGWYVVLSGTVTLVGGKSQSFTQVGDYSYLLDWLNYQL